MTMVQSEVPVLENRDDSDSDLDDFLPSGLSQDSSTPSTNDADEPTTTTTANKSKTKKSRNKLEGMMANPETIAQRKIRCAVIPKEVTCPSRLFWHRFPSKSKKAQQRYYPCRLAERDEIIGLALAQHFDETKKCAVEYLAYTNQRRRNVVHRSQLEPYGHDKVWAPTPWKHYMDVLRETKSPSDCRLEELYLKKLLQTALEREQKALASAATTPPPDVPENDVDHTSSSVDSDNDDDDDNDTVENKPARDKELGFSDSQHKKEPLRSGDVIEYTSPVFVAGNERGHRVTVILSVHPQDQTILRLQNGEVLPSEHPVKLSHRRVRDRLQANPQACFRPISSYKLRRCHGGDKYILANLGNESERIGRILKRKQDELGAHAQEAGVPEDILQFGHKAKKRRTDYSSDNKASSVAAAAPEEELVAVASVLAGEKEIAELQRRVVELKGKSRRLQSAAHMPLEQLELAITVRRRCLAEGMEPEALEQVIDTGAYRIEKFLLGDPQQMVRAAVHADTADRLRQWMKDSRP